MHRKGQTPLPKIRFSRIQDKKITHTYLCLLLVGLIVLCSFRGTAGLWIQHTDLSLDVFMIPSVSEEHFSPRDKSITWHVQVNITKAGGKSDFVFFGEAPDALDGPPVDAYDVFKPAPTGASFIRCWFNDTLPAPYDMLERDYRQYPDVLKTWNLSIQWVPQSGTPPATIIVDWNPTILNTSEYDQVNLYDSSGGQVADMLTTNTYSFVCPAYTPQPFTIAAVADTTPPEVINYSPSSGETGDIFVFNVSAQDDRTPQEFLLVKVNWSHGGLSGNETMVLMNGYFVKSITLSNDTISPLIYHFYARDAAKNPNSNYTVAYTATILDDEPPRIISMLATPLYQQINSYVNLTAVVMDNINIGEVHVRIDGPSGFTPLNLSMYGDGMEYFCNRTYTIAGMYNYSLWVTDTSGNSIVSEPYQFTMFGYLLITSLVAGWSFVSLPFNHSVDKAHLLVIFQGEEYSWVEAVNSNLVLSSIFIWDRNGQGYYLGDTLTPGYGYWMYSYVDCEVWATGVTSITTTPYVTTLLINWNVIGIPINQPVDKTTLLVFYAGVTYNWTQATTNQNPTGGPLILKDIFGWKRINPQEYELTNILQAGHSYWLFSFYDCILKQTL